MNWHEAQLSELALFTSGGTPRKSVPEFWDGEIPWISASSMGHIRLEDSDRKVTELGAKNGTRIASAGSTLILVRGMSLLEEIRIGYAARDVTFNQDVKALVARAAIDARFLTYSLLAWRPQLLAMVHQAGHGTGVLSTDRLKSLKIPYPEIDEQRRIAGVLGAFDDLIDSIRQEHSSRVELAQSVLQRSARHERAFARVGDVADVLRGLSYKGSGLSDSGIPMVNMGSAEDFGWLKRSGWKFYTGDFKPRHLAGARDLILVNTEQTWRQEILGWPLLVPGDVQEALFSHHTYRVAFKPGTEWMKLPLWAHLFTAEARSWIDGAVRGTTVANLPIGAVENLTFLVPGRLDPALKMAEALLELAWASEREVERLEGSRDELLPLLMSGRITVDEAWEAAVS